MFAWPLAKTFATKAIPDNDGEEAQDRCRFNKYFATVAQIRMAVLQVRVREDAVEEEQHRSGKDEIMQAPPQRTADAGAEQRREEHHQQEIERCSAREVEFWLKRRLYREEDVEQAESGFIQEEKDGGMRQRECDGSIGGSTDEVRRDSCVGAARVSLGCSAGT